MKIISYLEATVMLVGSVNLWRPDDGLPHSEIITELSGRYSFSMAGIGESTGMPAFQGGQFLYSDKNVAIHSFEFQQTGLVATGTKTDILEKFLEDVMMFICAKFDFKSDVSFKKAFRSTMLSQFDFEIGDALDRLDELTRTISAIASNDSRKYAVKPAGIKYMYWDGDRLVGDRQVIIEKRIGQEAGHGRIFSFVPASTEDHIRVLESFEKVFTPKGG